MAERSADNRAATISTGVIMLSILAWFALILWQSYPHLWQFVNDSNRLRSFGAAVVETPPGRLFLLAVLCYLGVVALLLASPRLPLPAIVSRFPMLYAVMGGVVLATYLVAGQPRRGALAVEIVAFVVLILVTYSAGRTITGRLLPASLDEIESFALSSAFGLGTLAVVTGAMAHLGILFHWSIFAVLLLFVVVSISYLTSTLRGVLFNLRNLTVGNLSRQSTIWKLTIPLMAGQAFFLFLAALLPETGSDALSGHLLYSRWFLEANGWVNLYKEDFHFGLPMGYNLLYVVPMALSDEVGARLIQYWSGILCMVGGFALGRRLFSTSSGLVAATILVNVPVFAWEMQTAFVDLVFAMFGSLAIFAMMRYHDQSDRRWLYAATVLAGFALNGKLQAVYVIALIPVSVLIGIPLRRNGLDRSVLLKDIVIPPLLAVAIGGSWYTHNLLVTGNPVIPFFNAVFHSPYYAPLNEVFDRDTFGVGDDFLTRYVLLPWNLVRFPERFQGNIGAAFLLFAPTLLVLPWRNRKVMLLVLLSGIYAVAMALTVPVSRYLLVILPPASALVSYGVSEGVGRLKGFLGKIAIAGTGVAFAIMYLVNLPVFYDIRHGAWVASSLHPGDLVFDAIGTVEARDRYVVQRIITYRGQKWAADNLSKTAKVVVYGEGRTFYLGPRALSADQVGTKGDLFSDDAQKLLRALERIGATHLLVNGNDAPGRKDIFIRLDSEFSNNYLQQLYARDGAYVFALRNGYSRSDKEPWVTKDMIYEFDSLRIPSDVAKENKVRVSNMDQENDLRRGILEIAPSRFEYLLSVPEASKVELAFGAAAMSTDYGDGVLARIEVVRDGQVEEVYRRFIDTNRRRLVDRRWFDERIELTSYSGQQIILRFIADMGPDQISNSTADWLLWSRPLILTTK